MRACHSALFSENAAERRRISTLAPTTGSATPKAGHSVSLETSSAQTFTSFFFGSTGTRGGEDWQSLFQASLAPETVSKKRTASPWFARTPTYAPPTPSLLRAG